MPTDESLRQYAARLPDIYRDILMSYPDVEPGRDAGYCLAFQTLSIHFINTGKKHSLGAVQAACKQLAEKGIVEIKSGIFAHPTGLGERLIASLTRQPIASSAGIPVLPDPPR